jgi:TRAP-type transport system periplasmic protein
MSEQLTTSGEKVLRWVLAHEPVSTFEAAARLFSQRVVSAGTGLRPEIFSAADYGRRLSPAEVIDKVAAGEIEMCQTYTSALGRFDERLLALDLPYLFRDHGHAARVLDGAVGQGLLGGMIGRGLRGLAFTYSGGFRVVATTGSALASAADARGLRVRTGESPVPEAFFAELGAAPRPAPLTEIASLAKQGAIDAAEITYPRYWDGKQPSVLPTVVETGHSLLLTMIVINEKYFQSLGAAQRDEVVSAAGEAARVERATSIAEGEQVKAKCPSSGVTLAEQSPAESRRWRAAGEKIRARFAPRFGQALVDSLAA